MLFRSIFSIALMTLLLADGASAAAPSCGGDKPCDVSDGDYRIEIPKDGDARGVYVFFHGWKGSAELQMQQRPLIDATLAHHLAFVAVDGLKGNWSFPDGREGRDEKTFIGHVLDDLHSRFGFTPRNTIIGGFSIGASMAWYTACQQGQKASAMVTFSGVFWDPLPAAEDCVSEIPSVVHFHGTADETFPLSGRAIGTQYHQGDTFKSFAVLRTAGRCDVEHTKKVEIDDLSCDDVPSCLHGDSVLCIHKEGHVARSADLDAGLTAVGFPR